ncbi:Fis family transcriptional regulator [Lampropedia cohaerens]|uniref:Fis family transcriptional regulator n=1 Tax=Lampropedia cohaerens TaxID=1610491 RepID=A0A0U1Q2M4_9BURK|nr:sigma-54 dependent transcriptional regulator [Lampropedia cohaerens]KKW68998.1 Fis family transcriptional regulator [Lampropedia cohaerens]
MSETNAAILVVDDEPDLRLLYELTLMREGYRVESAETVAQARQKLQARFDVVLTDMRLPDGQGMELLLELQAAGRPERCIVVTAYGSAENAVEALRAGAFDYLAKPVELSQLRTVVASALQGLPATMSSSIATAPPTGDGSPAAVHAPATPADRAAQTAACADAAQPAPHDTAAGAAALVRLVGQSPAMCAVKARIAKVARSMAPVHIHGESGTGKELVARAVHANSQRAAGPLVAVNCGAIPEHLLEAEFFGAKKGAYTGATQDRIGFFQAAKGGTLFLDEIGDLPLAMQTKLLRAIQERCVRPLGSTQEELVDVRLISATHRDLAAEVQQGRFRQDLYYRLNVIELHIPPLRERLQDLPDLVQALLTRLAADSGFAAIHVESDFLQALATRTFPGNVRELENLLHRAVALSEDGILRASALQDDSPASPVPQAPVPAPSPAPATAAAAIATAPAATGFGTSYAIQIPMAVSPAPPVPPPVPAAPATAASAQPTGAAMIVRAPDRSADDEPLPSDLQAWLDAQERAILIRALRAVRYNRTAAAALLGLNLRQIRYRIERLNIPTEPDARE